MTICELDGCKRPATTAIYTGSEWLKTCRECADRVATSVSGSSEYLDGIIRSLAQAKSVRYEDLN